MLFLSFDKAQKYENGQDRIFSRPWRDMAPNYIFGSLPLRVFFFLCVSLFLLYFSYFFIGFDFFSLFFIVVHCFSIV